MARRSPKVPIVSGPGTIDFAFTEDDWQRIEADYGVELPAEVRHEVNAAVRRLLLLWVLEQNAEPLENAEKTLLNGKKAAAAFHQALLAFTASSDAASYTRELIKDNLHDGGFLQSLIRLLHSFRAACDSALEELSSTPRSPSFEKGECWKSFIPALTEILQKAALPTGASKDGLTQSPFVDLVWAIQECLPVGCSLSVQSKPALAKVIGIARRIPGTENE